MSNNIFQTGGVKIPKKVVKLDLGQYHSDLKGSVLFVWVNLNKIALDAYTEFQVRLGKWDQINKKTQEELVAEIEEAQKEKKKEKELDEIRAKYNAFFSENLKSFEALNADIYEWYSMVWSQHSDPVHHSPADGVKAIAEASGEDNNSDFWKFLTQTTQTMIIDYRNRYLKK